MKSEAHSNGRYGSSIHNSFQKSFGEDVTTSQYLTGIKIEQILVNYGEFIGGWLKFEGDFKDFV